MRIASVAKLRALLVISCLLVGVASLGFWFQPPVSVGQEPGSDLPANWQSLNASEFADLTENYLLSADPQAASRQLLIMHAWNTFLATDAAASALNDALLDRLLGIVNLPNAESFGFVALGLNSYQQSLLMPRWQALKTRSTNAAIARLGEAGSLGDLLQQVTQIYARSTATSSLSAHVARQVGDWVASHAGDLNEATTSNLLSVLALLKSQDVQPVAITAQTWLTPAVSGAYQFAQLRHGVREGTLMMHVGGQAVYDSSQEGEARFESMPVTLTAGQRVLLETQYAFDPPSLLKTERATRDLGTERFPVLPVVGLLWQTGEEDPWELIPDAVLSLDEQGQQSGVTMTFRVPEGEQEISFSLNQNSLGWTGNVVSEAQVASLQQIAELLSARDPSELVTALEGESAPQVYAYVAALAPTERAELVQSWKERPDLLAKLSDSQFSRIWQQVYLLPDGLPLELLTAWSEASTDTESQMTLAERWGAMASRVASERALKKWITTSQGRLGAPMVGAFARVLDDLQLELVDDVGQADLPLLKVALAGAVASNRLGTMTSLIHQKLAESPATGDVRASWLIADAFKIEAVEGKWAHPEASARLNEALLVVEDAALRQTALYELILRTVSSQEAFTSVAATYEADLGEGLIASIRQWQELSQPPAGRGTETPAPASKSDPYKIVLQQRLEKAQQAGNQQLIARYQQLLGMQ